MDWEAWFRESSVSEIRDKLKALELENQTEADTLPRDVGERYADIIALADRLAALAVLGQQQEKHISDSGTYPSTTFKVPKVPKPVYSSGTKLAALADRSIVLKRYAIASQALYLAQQLEQPTKQICQQSERLTSRLNRWLESGTYISQSLYTGLLVHFRWTPQQLVGKFLKARLVAAHKLAADARIFKLVDSTTFIYAQLTDLARSRLSRRPLTAVPEFSGLNADEVLTYPTECYAETKGKAESIDSFISAVAQSTGDAVTQKLQSVGAHELVELLISFVQHAQAELGESAGAILVGCAPAFSQRLLALIGNEVKGNWEQQLLQTKSELQKVDWLARTTRGFGSQFSNILESLVKQGETQLANNIAETYSSKRTKLLSRKPETLDETAAVIRNLHILDASLTSLEGIPEAAPVELYETFARLLQENYDKRKSRRFFSHPQAARAFELQCMLDEQVGAMDWDVKGLAAVRHILGTTKNSEPTQTSEATKTSENTSDNTSEETEETSEKTTEKNEKTVKDEKEMSLLIRPLIV